MLPWDTWQQSWAFNTVILSYNCIDGGGNSFMEEFITFATFGIWNSLRSTPLSFKDIIHEAGHWFLGEYETTCI